MKAFWISWYGDAAKGFALPWPWWISGYRGDQPTICAAIRAEDERQAKSFVLLAYLLSNCDDVIALAERGLGEDTIEWRFCEEQPETWSPFCGRFPKADWMIW